MYIKYVKYNNSKDSKMKIGLYFGNKGFHKC